MPPPLAFASHYAIITLTFSLPPDADITPLLSIDIDAIDLLCATFILPLFSLATLLLADDIIFAMMTAFILHFATADAAEPAG
jgi:hypothetical protein